MLLSTRKIKIKSLNESLPGEAIETNSIPSLASRLRGARTPPSGGDPIRYLVGVLDHLVQEAFSDDISNIINPYSTNSGIEYDHERKTYTIPSAARKELRIPFHKIIIREEEKIGVAGDEDTGRPRLVSFLDFKFEDYNWMYIFYNSVTLMDFFRTGEIDGQNFELAKNDSYSLFGGAPPDLRTAADSKRYYLFLHYKVLESFSKYLNISAIDSKLKARINNPTSFTSAISPLDTYFDRKVITRIPNQAMGSYNQVGLEMLAPIAESKLITSDNDLSSMQFLSNENYNFFVREYEKDNLSPANPANQSLSEYFLPSSLAIGFINDVNNTMSDMLRSGAGAEDPIYNSYKSLRDAMLKSLMLDGMTVQVLESAPEASLTKKFFKEFGTAIQALQTRDFKKATPQGMVADPLLEIVKRYENIIIDTSANNRYNNKNKFPLYNEVTLIDDNYLNSLSISNSLFFNNEDKKRNTLFNLIEMPIEDRVVNVGYLDISLTDASFRNYESKKIKQIALGEFYNNVNEFYTMPHTIFGGRIEEKTKERSDEDKSNIESVYRKSLSTYLPNIKALDLQRIQEELHLIEDVLLTDIDKKIDSVASIKNLLLNEKEYFEIFAYKVVKTNLTTNVKQNFFVLNTNDEIIKFTDSQIKYEQEYSYEVFAYLFSFYDNYFYSPANVHKEVDTIGVDSIGLAEIVREYKTFSTHITAAKIPCIFEIPFVEERSLNVDSPPLAPNVDFFVKKDVNDRVHFLLSQKTGNSIEDPVIVTGNDREKFAKNARQQKRQDGKIFFKTDEPAYSYEIFRLTERPKNLKDFDGSKIEVVSTIAGQQTEVKEFFDTIRMNQDYYYLFRVVDNHGNISNPTNIFKFNLVNKNGSISPMLETIALNEIQPNQTSKKDLRSFLKISPSFLQKRMPAGQFENKSSNQLTGVGFEDLGEASVISTSNAPTKFLIEIKSKKTGKINFIELKYETDFSKFIS
jgi:hypothetical protein